MAFETCDPFLIRQEHDDPTLAEWDCLAHSKFIRLSKEEDVEDVLNGVLMFGKNPPKLHFKFVDLA
ncbi:hypothetical protein SLEP1_g14320 [Rubroshorea leprosula]|uniref:Uncharacterized protein n=1 Tax=Rubroshorea leprosula TaxID=152421 RepID=A0AAV5IN38_9ROSI|nr:hypothetical protein SLEP1_g14320 [Rubroshorea leprosula]